MGLIGCLTLASIADVASGQFSGGGSGPSTAQLEKGCYGGNPTDCDSAGQHYFDGKYAPKDFKRANALFQRACDGGEPSGCYNLGWSYQNGFGLSENPKQAALFFQRACDGGDAGGCAQLAFSYAIADGIKQDDTKAAIYAERACNGNAALGCYVLAGAYYGGVPGYPKDVNRAVTLFRRACNARTPITSACKRLDELGYPRRSAYVAPTVAQAAPTTPQAPKAPQTNSAGSTSATISRKMGTCATSVPEEPKGAGFSIGLCGRKLLLTPGLKYRITESKFTKRHGVSVKFNMLDSRDGGVISVCVVSIDPENTSFNYFVDGLNKLNDALRKNFSQDYVGNVSRVPSSKHVKLTTSYRSEDSFVYGVDGLFEIDEIAYSYSRTCYTNKAWKDSLPGWLVSFVKSDPL